MVREGEDPGGTGRLPEKLWLSCLAQARTGQLSLTVGQRFESLAAIAEAAKIRPDLRLRNEAIACMALPDLKPSRATFPAFARNTFCCDSDADSSGA